MDSTWKTLIYPAVNADVFPVVASLHTKILLHSQANLEEKSFNNNTTITTTTNNNNIASISVANL